MSSKKPTVEVELERLQLETFGYFLHETNSENGLVIDKTAPGGITASDGPGPGTRIAYGLKRRYFDYKGRGVPYGPDDGTIAPWAVVASLPFAPDIVLPALDYLINEVKLKTGNPYGWISQWHYGINQGPIIAMIENCRTGLLWRLMRNCPYIIAGLRHADFKGGWL